MSKECAELHHLASNFTRIRYPYNPDSIPANGIYILFEKDEKGHGSDRIVRVGSHTGLNQLYSRLNQHFEKENKDRSIFRKNIGRAILNKNNDSFLKFWDFDLTSRSGKDKYSHLVDINYKNSVEKKVTKYIKENFSFIVFKVDNKTIRLKLEKMIIATISLCSECQASANWFGSHSPKPKIAESGLWQEQHLYKTPFSPSDIDLLKEYMT